MAAILGTVALGCAGDSPRSDAKEPKESKEKSKPATVTAPVKEAALTSVTLTLEAEKRLAIRTATVDKRTVPRSRTLGGEIVAPSGAALAMTAPVAGTLQSPPAVPVAGSAVARGQTIFRLIPIQPSERDAAVDAQQAAETAAARREAAVLRVQRAERLVQDGSGSRRALEEARADLAVAEAELKGARERVVLAGRSGTSRTGVVIEAPETAVVQNVHVRDGQAVAAGAPLIDLVRLATVWVKVPVYAGEADRLDPNAPAHVLMLGDPPDAEGALARPIPAPPSANPTTAGVDLYYAMANTNQRLRPGERVAARLARRESHTGLVVPKAALLHDAYGGTWVYMAREPQVYARQRVVVADVSGPFAVLSQGPAEGARVVTDGAAELFGVEFGAGK
jgi:RND family efflux transporter MFP subunit